MRLWRVVKFSKPPQPSIGIFIPPVLSRATGHCKNTPLAQYHDADIRVP